MLAFLVATLLICVPGSLAEDSKCETGKEECMEMHRSGFDFPETREGWDNFCRVSMSRLSCLSDVYKICDGHEKEAQYASELLFYMETSLCLPDSPTYKVMTNNLQCISSSSEKISDSCDAKNLLAKEEKLPSKVDAFLREGLNDNIEEGSFSEADICVHFLLKIACSAVTVKELCGADVGEAVLQMGLNLDTNVRDCPGDIVSKMPYVVKALEEMTDVEENIEEAIRKRK